MDEMLINKLFIDGEYEQVISRLEPGIADKKEIAEEMLYKLYISAVLSGDHEARSEAVARIIDQFGGMNTELFVCIARGHMDESMIEASLTIKE